MNRALFSWETNMYRHVVGNERYCDCIAWEGITSAPTATLTEADN